ncbi:hypothetical protein SUSAZ_02085 [Sulfolobus acidocaldarius SUSAZ]|nr:hypothetical protein SUSAZ_02085 [Sulfolobus acidocaldarius SUSAZ]
MSVSFYNVNYTIIIPSMVTTILFVALSGIVPLFWKSRYSLYTSFAFSVLSISMLVVTYIWVSRYFLVNNYLVVPTENGIFYQLSSYNLTLGLSSYLLFVNAYFDGMDAISRSTWLDRLIGRKGTYIDLVIGIAKTYNMPYQKTEDGVIVGNDILITQGNISHDKLESKQIKKVYMVKDSHIFLIETGKSGNDPQVFELKEGMKKLLSDIVEKVGDKINIMYKDDYP